MNLEEKCGLLGCVSAQADQDHCAWKNELKYKGNRFKYFICLTTLASTCN